MSPWSSAYSEELRDTKRDLAVSESRLADYQQRLGKTFEHEQYMADLTRLRDQLRVGLSETPKEDQPSVSQLADEIKALKSSQLIESGPQRSETRTISAEEPVTTRIRRQLTRDEPEDETFQSFITAAKIASPCTSHER